MKDMFIRCAIIGGSVVLALMLTSLFDRLCVYEVDMSDDSAVQQ